MEAEKTNNTGEVYYADGEAAATPQLGKQGHLFCGCCCDTRRATIIVNIINVCFAVIGLAGLSVIATSNFANQFDDDAVRKDFAAAQQYIWVPILISCLNLICSGLGLYGGLKFNNWMVMTAAVWYTINACLSLIGADIVNAGISALFAYPHYIFFNEMKKGIMTEMNYPNEKHSCCCA